MVTLPRIEPAKLAIARDVFNHPNWVYELKYDGFRALTYVSSGKAWTVSKKGFTYKRFDDLCHHVASACRSREAILDGEIVCVDEQGRPRFYDLMFRRGEPCLTLFDILWKDGQDLLDLPLLLRKKMLRKLVPQNDTHLLYVDHCDDGHGLYDLVCQQDLEGVIMKPKGSPYASNRWLKIKNPDYSQWKGRREISLIGILLIKWIIWAVSLGSGTSGGVLAPLLMMGGALGGLGATFLPSQGVGFWPLVSMGAVLGGTMRSPFTGIIFVLELTHDINVLLPLVVAVTIAHGFTVLSMQRSILTEKVSRRGYHLSREYAVDPLEVLFVREVMRTNIVALPSSMFLNDLGRTLPRAPRSQRLFPVTDSESRLIGVVTQAEIQKYIEEQALKSIEARLGDVVRPDPIKAYPNEPLTNIVNRMAETGFTEFPVVEPSNPQKLLGLVSLHDLLNARVHRLQEEHRRERVFPLRLVLPAGMRWQRMKPIEREDTPVEVMRNDTDGKWSRVISPDCWNGLNGGFTPGNAKMVCKKCHREFPFDLKCEACGDTNLVLGTAAATPGIFCSTCRSGQWHWDCPACGRRQDFADPFFYDKSAITVRARHVA